MSIVRDRGGNTTFGNKFKFNSGYDFTFATDQAPVTQFNLNGRGSQDITYVRPVISFDTYDDAGCPACICFNMRVQVNGALYTYTKWSVTTYAWLFVEEVNSQFLERNGLYENGSLYKTETDSPSMALSSFAQENRNDFQCGPASVPHWAESDRRRPDKVHL